jgi:hypothetical protein
MEQNTQQNTDIKVAFIGASALHGKKSQARSWTYGLVKTADKKGFLSVELTEERLDNKKKRDVVDSGHKKLEITEITEKQLDKEHDKTPEETFEKQLDKKREGASETLTEGSLEKQHNPKAHEGDRLKIFEITDDLDKKRDKANSKYKKASVIVAQLEEPKLRFSMNGHEQAMTTWPEWVEVNQDALTPEEFAEIKADLDANGVAIFPGNQAMECKLEVVGGNNVR